MSAPASEPPNTYQVWVCRGHECSGQRDGDQVFERFVEVLARAKPEPPVVVRRSVCFGRCSRGPNVYVRAPRPSSEPAASAADRPATPPSGRSVLYHQVAPSDVGTIVEQHVLGGYPVAEIAARARVSPGGLPESSPGSPPGSPPDSGPQDGPDNTENG
ncbi:MAG: (2Fe-2S) ferredoxin domain-containing protein [Myxococcota bacterium]